MLDVAPPVPPVAAPLKLFPPPQPIRNRLPHTDKVTAKLVIRIVLTFEYLEVPAHNDFVSARIADRIICHDLNRRAYPLDRPGANRRLT